MRVEKRRGDELYINDGAYGALFDAAHIGWRYPVRLVRETRIDGPADGIQLLRPDLRRPRPHGGAVLAPRRCRAGDYIEIGMLGAYGCAMRTRFNGFGAVRAEIVDDEPMASLYVDRASSSARTS